MVALLKITEGNSMSTNNVLINQIAAAETLEAAYNSFNWLGNQHFSDDWVSLRQQWGELKPHIQAQLQEGEYAFQPVTRVHDTDQLGEPEIRDFWAAPDRLVLKAMSLVLEQHLREAVSPRCYHALGRGGAKAAVREVRDYLQANPDTWVMQTNVEDYHTNIDHHTLYMQLEDLMPKEKSVMDLVWRYLRHSVCDGENYIDIERGISLGCPLSPLMGAVYLKPLDEMLVERHGFYVRFVDDLVLTAPTRWKLRAVVKKTNMTIGQLKLTKHPDKTFIGRASRGIDFLGYHLTPTELTMSKAALQRRDANIARLYVQGASQSHVEQYVLRWQQWATAGIVEPLHR